MRRREFMALLGAAAWPLVARAQQKAMPVVGFLDTRSPESDAPFVAGFRRGLQEAGYVPGKNVALEFRWAHNQPDRLPALAADLVARGAAVIVAGGGMVAARAAKGATSSIPIVFVNGTDPVKTGLVASLNRPGGNVTGVSFLATSIVGKRLELLRNIVPRADAFAVLVNPANPDFTRMSSEVQEAARTLGLRLTVFKASSESDIGAAFAKMEGQHFGALLIGGDSFFDAMRQKLAALALRHALPAIFDVREFAAEGGLMSYGASQTDAYRRAGIYTGKILAGAQPANLPVMQSTRLEFVLNLATAKALGLDVPAKLLALADEVIE